MSKNRRKTPTWTFQPTEENVERVLGHFGVESQQNIPRGEKSRLINAALEHQMEQIEAAELERNNRRAQLTRIRGGKYVFNSTSPSDGIKLAKRAAPSSGQPPAK